MDHTSLVSHLAEPMQNVGQAFYFTPETQAIGEAIGLSDITLFYGLGRGGIMGDVDAGTVADAFYWFKPDVVEMLWNAGTSAVSASEAAAAHLAAAHAFGRAAFADTPELQAFVVAAAKVADAVDGFPAPLFSGYRAVPLPEDAPAAAMQLAVEMRELRGDAFVAAARELDLAPAIGHYITSPDNFALFGYSEQDVPLITEEDRARRHACEIRCEELLHPAFEVLTDEEILAFAAGAELMHAAAGPIPDLPTA